MTWEYHPQNTSRSGSAAAAGSASGSIVVSTCHGYQRGGQPSPITESTVCHTWGASVEGDVGGLVRDSAPRKMGSTLPRGSAGAARADSDPTKAPNLCRSEDELCHVAQPELAWGLQSPTFYKECRYKQSERSYGSSARAPHRTIPLRLPINWAEALSAALQSRSSGAYRRYK